MSAPRRLCPVCRREIAVVAGRYARHDPALQPTLDGAVVSDFPGQLPLF
ncbi:hypothetical protein ACIHCQ_30470 [Streptomyces sp. NPDC052236]